MRRPAAVIVASCCAALALAAPAGPAGSANPMLIATVGTNDGFDIGLANPDGTPATRIPPGTYDFLVRDRSTAHNFHLASNEDSTVDFRTELAFVGEMTFTATLKDDTQYAYACEPHWQTMNGSFLVTSRPVAPPPPKPVAPPVLRAGVTASGKAFTGARSIRAGRYRLVVQDRSSRANFHFVGRGVNRRTGMRFRGTASWTVRLVRGAYRYGSDPKPLASRLTVR